MSATFPLTLYYDAACPVCALEMDHLRERDAAQRLRFVDIAAPGFDAAALGLDLAALDAELHGRWADGSTVTGMAALRAAYDAAGLGWVLRPTGFGPLRPAFDAAYRLFAQHRRRISHAAAPVIEAVRSLRARRTSRRMADCRSGACSVAPREDVS